MNNYISNMSPEEAKAFLRKVMGPNRKRLEGQERENVWLMILMQEEPTSFSNNQHSITEVYIVNQREYHVTYMIEDEPIIEEILPDDI
jgi:hypothetical protein